MMEYLKDCRREEKMCVKESFLYVWFLLYTSTRGSSDSIAPRDSLPTGSQDMKGSLLRYRGPSMQGKGQVLELNHDHTKAIQS